MYYTCLLYIIMMMIMLFILYIFTNNVYDMLVSVDNKTNIT